MSSAAAVVSVRRDPRFAALLLFGLLCGYSLFVGDYSQFSLRIISALVFALTALYLALEWKQNLSFCFAFICPLAMFLYGLGQTAWSDQKIIYNGLDKSLFWLAASSIGLLGAQIFRQSRTTAQFRVAIALFGSFESLLSVLQQASHTGKYLWLVPSGFPDIYGTFPYYNNFSQLIELSLPVTLWEAIRHREIRLPFLFCAALQVGAVVSSASRAGAILVFLELAAVLFLAWFQRRGTLSLTVIVLAFVLSLGFAYAAGFHQVITKLEKPDQLSNRRLINQSSVNMIKARPLTGWGLGAYVPVYKMFALYDDGTWVNQAHNDYLEWAAEGGIPYACLMLLLIGWTVKPAVRSIWGIGLLAFCLHALVDYPFARLGTCGWYFVMAGLLAAQKNGSSEERRRTHRRDSRRVEAKNSEPAAQPLPA